jgi:hypothetical protein
MRMTDSVGRVTAGEPLKRIAPGEYENGRWYVIRQAEDDGSADFGRSGRAIHPFGYEYTPAVEWSWFVYDKRSGDLHDAYPTLREARRVAEAGVVSAAEDR